MCHHLNIQMYIIFIWDIVGIIDNYIREKYVGTQKKKKKRRIANFSCPIYIQIFFLTEI